MRCVHILIDSFTHRLRLGISLYFLSLYLFQTCFLSDSVGMGGIALLCVIAFVLLVASRGPHLYCGSRSPLHRKLYFTPLPLSPAHHLLFVVFTLGTGSSVQPQ